MNENEEEVEIDLDHPWVQAAMAITPTPTPASAQVLPVEIPGPENKSMRAAMLTTISNSAVQTIFLPPNALMQLVEQAHAIFQYWDKQQSQGLVIADRQTQKVAERIADQMKEQGQQIKRH